MLKRLLPTFGAVLLLAAACGSASPPTAHTTESEANAAVALAQCMRAHGMAKFPDPTSAPPVGRVTVIRKLNIQGIHYFLNLTGTGIDPQSQSYLAAMSACQSKLGTTGGGTTSASPQTIKTAAVLMAKCMRSHGIVKFPDPVFGDSAGDSQGGEVHSKTIGGVTIVFNLTNTGINQSSQQFKTAANTCQAAFDKAVDSPADSH